MKKLFSLEFVNQNSQGEKKFDRIILSMTTVCGLNTFRDRIYFYFHCLFINVIIFQTSVQNASQWQIFNLICNNKVIL